jgi:hypothetical protein
MGRDEVLNTVFILYAVTRIVVVATTVVFLLLKALAFRRAGRFGDAMAKSNFVIALAFLGTLMLVAGLAFFRTTPWVLGISFAVLVYVVRGGIEFKRLYGSWQALLHEAWLTVKDLGNEWCAQPLGMRIATILLLVEFWVAVGLVQVKGTPEELQLPSMWVTHPVEPTPTPSADADVGSSYVATWRYL